jgi:ABC-type antimicrobial peptide transport system permease subunit
MDEIVLETTYPWAVGSLFLAVFGAGALLLASVGVYGLVAYSVAQRRREIGVRMALGARAPQVRRLVVGEGLRLALSGGAAGLVGALLLAQAVRAVLFRVRPFDPLALAAVVVLLLAVTVAASLVPAVRATRLDPARVLGVD